MRNLLLVTLIPFLFSCVTPFPVFAEKKGISSHRLSDLNELNYSLEVDYFGEGETPAVLIQGYSGKTVSLHLRDKLAGISIGEKAHHIPNGKVKWVSYGGLPSGTYQVTLIYNGVVQGATTFTIR